MAEQVTHTPDDIAALVADRENTHGDFAHSARITQSIKGIFRAFPTWPDLDPCQREALEMIACKMGRILAGDRFRIAEAARVAAV